MATGMAPGGSTGRELDSLNPELLTLRSELEQLDYVVVPHGDHICVRLPLISSVRIRHEEGRFRFTPQFGPFRRSGGFLFTSLVSTAVVAGTAFAAGFAPITLVAGFVGIMAVAHDACRFIVTEGCLTRLQHLIARTGVLGSARRKPLPEARAVPLIEA